MIDCCVIGLGSFGYQLSEALMEDEVKVLAIDTNFNLIESIEEKVSHAVCIKKFDEESIFETGIDKVDVIVIALDNDFENTVMLTVLLKKRFEKKTIICRTIDDQHKEILELIGSDYVILPEQEASMRLADKISQKYRNLNRITHDYSYAYIKVKNFPNWIGNSIENIKEFYDKDITVLGKRHGESILKIEKNYIFNEKDLILISGKNLSLKNLF